MSATLIDPTEVDFDGRLPVWRLAWRVSQHHRRSFWLGLFLFIAFFTFPVLNGWLLGRGFSALEEGRTSDVYVIAALVFATEMARMTTIHWGALVWTRAWVHMQSFVRANLLVAQLSSGGAEAGRPVGSAGEAITHFRDDVEDVTMFIDGLVDVSAGTVFTLLAGGSNFSEKASNVIGPASGATSHMMCRPAPFSRQPFGRSASLSVS